MLRRCKWMVVLALALVATGSASASADTITVTTGPDPTEDVLLPVSVSWTSGSTNQYAFVTIKPAGSLTCAPSYAADEPTSEGVVSAWTSSVAGSRSGTVLEGDPGTYVLCAYLQSRHADTIPAAASGPIPVTLRSAHAAISLTAAPQTGARHRVLVSAAVTAELSRHVFVTAERTGGRGCEAAHTLKSRLALISAPVQGTQTLSAEFTAPKDGTYLLCAYVQEGLHDVPEATASTTFVVGPDPCVLAKARLTAARKAVRQAESAVARSRKRSQRYRRAVRIRAAERRKLQRARAAVADAC